MKCKVRSFFSFKIQHSKVKIKNFYFLLHSLLFILLFSACQEKPTTQQEQTSTQKEIVKFEFNADSAYYFIEKQVSFGPRVPNTPQHDSCGDWLTMKLGSYVDKIYTQTGKVEAFDGTQLSFTNIIGAFNPDKKQRIALFAHWDSRPFADQADSNQREPIIGANDGASGVGVLLEIARHLKNLQVDKGIDIILFDVEDYGAPSWSQSNQLNTYCLGSQYWADQPHVNNYNAQYGILLDMVGAENATFCMEGYSMQYAPTLMRDIWNLGIDLGYSNHFCFSKTPPITDDHYYINTLIGIPTIDIIQYDPSTSSYFGSYWHTHEDDINIINKNTLRAVGETVGSFIIQ